MGKVTLHDVSKSFDGIDVVRHFNIEIADGEFIVLVGPSGCGKSTTLRMIAGLEDISSGTVTIADRIVNDLAPHKRNIAMVFQNYALYPHKSVRENIIFGLKKAGASAKLIEQRLETIAELLQLKAFLDRKPADLSGGQRQRVAMGRALVRDAEVFLFDEPLSNLDARLRHHMRTEIARIHQQYRTTTVYVTHDQIEAMTLGQRVVVMRDGMVEQIGTPMEIFLNPVNTFVATFIGSPAMNLIDARVENGEVVFGQFRLPGHALAGGASLLSDSKRRVKLGIRAEFFQDASYCQVNEEQLQLTGLKVDIIEPLGFDQEISFTLAEQSVKARLDLRSQVKISETIDLVVDNSRLLLFDADTGGRIS
jgi:multiple sugar transport system ATP-binding protein